MCITSMDIDWLKAQKAIVQSNFFSSFQTNKKKDLPNNSFTASYPYLIWKVGVIVTLSVETLTMYLQAMPWTPAPSANVWTTTAASVEAEWKPFVFRRRSRRSHWYLLCLLH